jgi:hypothetical protein
MNFHSDVRRLISLAVVGGLSLVACGGSDEASSATLAELVETSTTEAAAVTDPVPVVTDPVPVVTDPVPVETDPVPVETDPVPVETDPVPVETDPVPVATEPRGSLPDCLVGDWTVTDSEMNAYYDALASGIPNLSIDTVGNVGMTFTGTDYVYIGDFTLMLEVAGQSGSGDATGSASGTYVVEDGIINSELVSSDLNIVITVGGTTVDGSSLGNAFLAANPLVDTPVSCDGPTLMFQSGETGATRHPVVLTPA